MKYQIIGKNIEVTDAIKAVLEEKLSRMDKYFVIDDSVLCRAVVRAYKVGAKVEVTIFTKQMDFRAEVRDNDLYKALEYKSFQDYVEQELHLDRTTAYKYIKIVESKNFEIIKENSNIGIAKLYIIALLEQSILEKLLSTINLQNITVKKGSSGMIVG